MEYRVMPGLGLYLLRVKLVFMAKKVKLHWRGFKEASGGVHITLKEQLQMQFNQ